MHVQRVAMPASPIESWTVLGDDDTPVEPIERFLAYLTDIERSPNTVRAYAHDLKDYWLFLDSRGLDWREVRLEDVGEFVAWLRLPPVNGQVVVPAGGQLKVPTPRGSCHMRSLRCSATRQAGEQYRRGCPRRVGRWNVRGQSHRSQRRMTQHGWSGQGPGAGAAL
jgi:Phage integrase, N-terminal SAM-like domain